MVNDRFVRLGPHEAVNLEMICSAKAIPGGVELRLANGVTVVASGEYAEDLAETLEIDMPQPVPAQDSTMLPVYMMKERKV